MTSSIPDPLFCERDRRVCGHDRKIRLAALDPADHDVRLPDPDRDLGLPTSDRLILHDIRNLKARARRRAPPRAPRFPVPSPRQPNAKISIAASRIPKNFFMITSPLLVFSRLLYYNMRRHVCCICNEGEKMNKLSAGLTDEEFAPYLREVKNYGAGEYIVRAGEPVSGVRGGARGQGTGL